MESPRDGKLQLQSLQQHPNSRLVERAGHHLRPGAVSISPSPATINENAGTLTFTITRLDNSQQQTILRQHASGSGLLQRLHPD